MSDRDLIARLATALRVQLDGVSLYSELLAEADARALLAEAQPQPVEPTDEELIALADDCDLDRLEGERFDGVNKVEEGCWEAWDHQLIAFARAALQRWGRPAPEPVSVAERLRLGASSLRQCSTRSTSP
jgi:hypothetical protein